MGDSEVAAAAGVCVEVDAGDAVDVVGVAIEVGNNRRD